MGPIILVALTAHHIPSLMPGDTVSLISVELSADQ
jgi:hypothetical protein